MIGVGCAEVTGRTKRLISTGDGRQKLETRSTRTSQAEAAAFMQGLKRRPHFLGRRRDGAIPSRINGRAEPGATRPSVARAGLARGPRHSGPWPNPSDPSGEHATVPARHDRLQRRTPLHQHDCEAARQPRRTHTGSAPDRRSESSTRLIIWRANMLALRW